MGNASLTLTPFHAKFLGLALRDMAEKGVDLGQCGIEGAKLTGLTLEVSAQLLIAIQAGYSVWLKQLEGSPQIATSQYRSIRQLVSRLLPLARNQVLLLPGGQRSTISDAQPPTVTIRLCDELIHKIANLRSVVIEHGLEHVLYRLRDFEFSWWVQYPSHHDWYMTGHNALCVSSEELWVQCNYTTEWQSHRLDTERVALSAVAPVLLMGAAPTRLVSSVNPQKLKDLGKRIQAFREARRSLDVLADALYSPAGSFPDDHLVLLENLRSEGHDVGPLGEVRDAISRLESDHEFWERKLEIEGCCICSAALGIDIGDAIVVTRRGEQVHLRVDSLDTHCEEDGLSFAIAGTRFRKDGLLGKRKEWVSVPA